MPAPTDPDVRAAIAGRPSARPRRFTRSRNGTDVPSARSGQTDVPSGPAPDDDRPPERAAANGHAANGHAANGHAPANDPRRPILTVVGLRVTVAGGRAEAVHGVSFTVCRGETVGLVGESGSGKSLTCRAVLGLLAPGCDRSAGRVELDGIDLTTLRRREWDAVRGARIGTVFQDPASYLNPSITVGRQLAEAVRAHRGLGRAAAKARAVELFAAVGLRDPETVYRRYPHELSGGMAQRVLIAVALSGDPDLLIADEATSSLDVLVQAEVLALLRRLTEERGLALVLVSHDLAVVAEVCERVLVYHRGHLVEQGPTADVIAHPQHPHTRELLDAALVWHPDTTTDQVPSRPADESPGAENGTDHSVLTPTRSSENTEAAVLTEETDTTRTGAEHSVPMSSGAAR